MPAGCGSTRPVPSPPLPVEATEAEKAGTAETWPFALVGRGGRDHPVAGGFRWRKADGSPQRARSCSGVRECRRPAERRPALAMIHRIRPGRKRRRTLVAALFSGLPDHRRVRCAQDRSRSGGSFSRGQIESGRPEGGRESAATRVFRSGRRIILRRGGPRQRALTGNLSERSVRPFPQENNRTTARMFTWTRDDTAHREGRVPLGPHPNETPRGSFAAADVDVVRPFLCRRWFSHRMSRPLGP